MRVGLLVSAVLVAFLAGCHGDGDTSRPGGEVYATACAGVVAPPPSVSTARVRRLTDDELDAVVSRLLGGERISAFSGLVPDPRAEGYDDDARALVVSGPKLDAYVGVAESLAPRIAATAACYRLESPRACAERLARRIAPRAFGRPVTEEEIAGLLAVYDSADEPARGMNALVAAVLVAPSTLYRTEIGTASQTGTGEIALDDFEIASQLSFLVTGARPDDALRDAAAAGLLRHPAVVQEHARRLLATPEARAQMRRFFVGWLELGRIDDIVRLGMPELTPAVKQAMADEMDRFVEHSIFEGRGTLDDLLLSSTSFPGPALASIYGADLLEAPRDGRSSRLDPTHRRGVLSLPAFLTQHSGIDATNPVDRGLFVRTRLLCQELGAPPLAAFKSPIPPASDKSTTTRQKYEQHSRDPACSGCHSLMDPLGFGFERFDAIGRYRTTEHGQNVDDSGQVTDADVAGAFHGPAQLAELLAGSDDMRACFVAQMYRFAEGRRPDDPCELGSLTDQFIARGDRIDELLVAYVGRREFFVRRVVP